MSCSHIHALGFLIHGFEAKFGPKIGRTPEKSEYRVANEPLSVYGPPLYTPLGAPSAFKQDRAQAGAPDRIRVQGLSSGPAVLTFA